MCFYRGRVLSFTFNGQPRTLIKTVHIYEKYQIGARHTVWSRVMFRLEQDAGHKEL